MTVPSAHDIPFTQLYEKLGPRLPWNIGGPQPAVRAICDAGGFSGHVLDIGCGVGDNAIYLASTGLEVTAVDVSEVAVESAREKAAALGVDVDFRVGDAFGLAETGLRFETILDSAFFHVLTRDRTPAYRDLLRAISAPGTVLHLFTFSEELTPDYPGPRRVSASELRTDFSAEWEIDGIRSARYHSSLPAEAVASMVDPRTQQVNAPTLNLTDQGIDDEGNVVSTIWHMKARRTAPPR